MIFCDTSTLAKYYVQEVESAAVRARIDGEDRVFLSELARVELMSLFHRRRCERRWTRREFLATVRQFSNDDLGGYWTWIPLDPAIVEQTTRLFTSLPEKVFLRAGDALHLVTALASGFREIHTHDRHQIQAASALGLDAVTL